MQLVTSHVIKNIIRKKFEQQLSDFKRSCMMACSDGVVSQVSEERSSCFDVSLEKTKDHNTDPSIVQTLSKNALKRMKRWELKKQQKKKGTIHNLDGNNDKKLRKLGNDNDVEAPTDVVAEGDLLETDYYFENGLRKVYPYYYQFTAHAKGRWFGLKLIDVFTNEFRDYSVDACTKSIVSGKITVNGKLADLQHIIKNGDFITNAVHRHELPVAGEPLELIEDNESVVVVNKPSSIPIHPCGRYRHNTIIYILAKEHGFRNLRGIYRLDRLTSGVLIFCKSEEKTREMMKHIKDRSVKKEYVCRVQGQFPGSPLECNEPIDVLSQKLGVYRCGPNGKESKTSFELLSTDGESSVVRCLPQTGRTHQIRVHLQFLGFPIINDPVYNSDVWGPERGKGGRFGKSDAELIADLELKHTYKNHLDLLSDDAPGCDVVHCDGGPAVNEEIDCPAAKRIKTNDDDRRRQSMKISYDVDCRECQLRFRDPSPDELVMFLHALRYQGPGWCYSTRLPAWASVNWKSV